MSTAAPPQVGAGAQKPAKVGITERARAERKLAWTLCAPAVVMMLLVTLFVIVNTIRVAVHARRTEIEIMKLVGATDWFIRWPFVIEGVIVGAMGGLLAIGLLLVAKIALVDPLAEQFALIAAPDTMNFAGLVGLLLLASVAVSAAGSGLSLRRFLRV